MPAARRYAKLKPTEDADLVALWSAGGMTADDLAARFGMSRRGIQQALIRLGSPKKGGARPAPRVLAVPPIPAPPAKPADRQRGAIDSAYVNAVHLEALTMLAVNDAVAGGGIPALRALDLAASALARLTTIKRAAAGLGAINPITEADLPELPIREITPAEIAAMRAQQLADDAEGLAHMHDDDDEDDDLISEGDDGLSTDSSST
ncbi:hypothetical protein ACLF3G_20115 [Falsiroseomonas sp. HC035]|uniref:hypothetical protein n=1 Tax=Falsiroseomonas sp. HC035 TaxID=3390999 RepID=UPI003D31114C